MPTHKAGAQADSELSSASGGSAYRLFWGDLHNHNGVGYAKGSLVRSIDLAREHLDFFAFTGHAAWHDMPKMPGDMFYRAVERIRPHLCRRFLFMTGYKREPRIDSFIRDVNGNLLWKPFPLEDLMAAIRTVLAKAATAGTPVPAGV